MRLETHNFNLYAGKAIACSVCIILHLLQIVSRYKKTLNYKMNNFLFYVIFEISLKENSNKPAFPWMFFKLQIKCFGKMRSKVQILWKGSRVAPEAGRSRNYRRIAGWMSCDRCTKLCKFMFISLQNFIAEMLCSFR